MIGSLVKLLKIGPYAPTGSSASCRYVARKSRMRMTFMANLFPYGSSTSCVGPARFCYPLGPCRLMS